MRQIEQLGQVLAEMLGRLLRIRKAGSASLSIDEIRSIYSDELDLTLDLVLATPADEIIEVLTSRVKFMDRHLEKMALAVDGLHGILGRPLDGHEPPFLLPELQVLAGPDAQPVP